MNLSKNVDFNYGGAAIAAADNTDSNSTRYDMSGYDGIVFLTTITDSVATGVATLKAEGNTIDSDTGMAAITGATATVTCAVNDDVNGKLLIVDVYKPQKRYIQGVRTSGTANIAFGEIHAIRYKGKMGPLALSSTTSARTTVVGS
jgi:hypothetical protein